MEEALFSITAPGERPPRSRRPADSEKTDDAGLVKTAGHWRSLSSRAVPLTFAAWFSFVPLIRCPLLAPKHTFSLHFPLGAYILICCRGPTPQPLHQCGGANAGRGKNKTKKLFCFPSTALKKPASSPSKALRSEGRSQLTNEILSGVFFYVFYLFFLIISLAPGGSARQRFKLE